MDEGKFRQIQPVKIKKIRRITGFSQRYENYISGGGVLFDGSTDIKNGLRVLACIKQYRIWNCFRCEVR